ncbi:MAG: hypothetical protein ACRCSN_13185 [Dermatophilaceae bacterium]
MFRSMPSGTRGALVASREEVSRLVGADPDLVNEVGRHAQGRVRTSATDAELLELSRDAYGGTSGSADAFHERTNRNQTAVGDISVGADGAQRAIETYVDGLASNRKVAAYGTRVEELGNERTEHAAGWLRSNTPINDATPSDLANVQLAVSEYERGKELQLRGTRYQRDAVVWNVANEYTLAQAILGTEESPPSDYEEKVRDPADGNADMFERTEGNYGSGGDDVVNGTDARGRGYVGPGNPQDGKGDYQNGTVEYSLVSPKDFGQMFKEGYATFDRSRLDGQAQALGIEGSVIAVTNTANWAHFDDVIIEMNKAANDDELWRQNLFVTEQELKRDDATSKNDLTRQAGERAFDVRLAHMRENFVEDKLDLYEDFDSNTDTSERSTTKFVDGLLTRSFSSTDAPRSIDHVIQEFEARSGEPGGAARYAKAMAIVDSMGVNPQFDDQDTLRRLREEFPEIGVKAETQLPGKSTQDYVRELLPELPTKPSVDGEIQELTSKVANAEIETAAAEKRLRETPDAVAASYEPPERPSDALGERETPKRFVIPEWRARETAADTIDNLGDYAFIEPGLNTDFVPGMTSNSQAYANAVQSELTDELWELNVVQEQNRSEHLGNAARQDELRDRNFEILANDTNLQLQYNAREANENIGVYQKELVVSEAADRYDDEAEKVEDRLAQDQHEYDLELQDYRQQVDTVVDNLQNDAREQQTVNRFVSDAPPEVIRQLESSGTLEHFRNNPDEPATIKWMRINEALGNGQGDQQ